MERDVFRVSPCMRTVTSENGENVPTRYRMSSLKTLYIKFCSENGSACSFCSFARNITSNIKQPNPMTSNTCLCRTCLNSEIKLEKLSKTEKYLSLALAEDSTHEDVRQIMDKLCKIKANKSETIEYVEWQLVDSPYQSSKRALRRGRIPK